MQLTLRSGATPAVPSSKVTVVGFTQAKYCVSSYAPTSKVSVTGPGSTTATIHTSNLGTGCTQLTVESVCGSAGDRVIAATGIGADGNPATSSATLPPSTGTASCAPSSAAAQSAGGSGGLSHGLGVGLLIGAVLLAVVVAAGALALRRRRASSE